MVYVSFWNHTDEILVWGSDASFPHVLEKERFDWENLNTDKNKKGI